MNNTGLNPGQLKSLKKISDFLGFARTKIDPDITAQRILILITVCLNEGLSQNELLEKLDKTSVTALSRNLADLSVLSSRKLKGPGLIELRSDPLNLRKKRVYLTSTGRRYLAKWVATLQ